MAQFVSHPFIRQDKIEDRGYQRSLAEKILSKGNTLVVAPTALGKTVIAALVTAEKLSRGGKVLVLAPTKPLALQHYNSFSSMLNVGQGNFALFTGETIPVHRREEWDRARVITATPQTIENDLSSGKISLADVSLVVFDEAHRAVKDYAYVKIADNYIHCAKKPHILALTASPGSNAEKIQEVCGNLHITNIEIKTEEDEDIAPYVQAKAVEQVKVELPAEFSEISALLESYIKELTEKLRSSFNGKRIITKKDVLNMQAWAIRKRAFGIVVITAGLLNLMHGREMLETQGIAALNSYFLRLKEKQTKSAKMIQKDARLQKAMFLAAGLLGKVEHPKLAELRRIVSEKLALGKSMIIFAHYRDSAASIAKSLEDLPDARTVRFVGQATRAKDKGLSQKEQGEIIRKFRGGEYNVLVCTSVGEEGLDIPSVDVVIFYEPVPSEIRTIQRSGRTGRFRPGEIITLVTRGTRDEANYWSARQKERKMRKEMGDMKENMDRQRTLGAWDAENASK